MSPLTHAPPPRPLRAIHVAEVQRAAQTIAEAAIAYLRRLMAVLEYPRTEWARGTGVSARTGAVSATMPVQTAGAAVSGVYVTGSDTPTTSAIANKAVLLATMVGSEQPVRSIHRYYDGRLYSAIPDGKPLPPAVPHPSAPTPIDMSDLDEDTYQSYIEGWGKYLAAFVEYLLDKEWREHFAFVTRFPTGTVEAVNTQQKTARVRLDADSEGGEAVTQVCGFGPREWTSAQLKSKQVRVGHDPTLGWFVDDLNG